MYTRFPLVPKSITLDDLERINAVFASLCLPKWRFSASLRKKYVAKFMISNIRPRILIGSRLVASMSLELFVRGLYTRTAVVRHPCFSWAFLLTNPPVWRTDEQAIAYSTLSIYAVCCRALKIYWPSVDLDRYRTRGSLETSVLEAFDGLSPNCLPDRRDLHARFPGLVGPFLTPKQQQP